MEELECGIDFDGENMTWGRIEAKDESEIIFKVAASIEEYGKKVGLTPTKITAYLFWPRRTHCLVIRLMKQAEKNKNEVRD